jgi:hypothetical protein
MNGKITEITKQQITKLFMQIRLFDLTFSHNNSHSCQTGSSSYCKVTTDGSSRMVSDIFEWTGEIKSTIK